MGIERILLALACVASLFAGGGLTRSAAAQEVRAEEPKAAAVRVDLQGRLRDLEVVEHDGRFFVVVPPEGRLVPADLWLGALQAAHTEQGTRGLLYVFFNITTPWSLVWIAVGFAGQALFTLRMLLQWYASEKSKRSVVPVGFWWGSLFGGILLLAYFVWRKDVVGVVGQSTGVFVYARNLVLIYRNREPRNRRTEPSWSATSSHPLSPTPTGRSTSAM